MIAAYPTSGARLSNPDFGSGLETNGGRGGGIPNVSTLLIVETNAFFLLGEGKGDVGNFSIGDALLSIPDLAGPNRDIVLCAKNNKDGITKKSEILETQRFFLSTYYKTK